MHISNGILADSVVILDEAIGVGQWILNKMVGKPDLRLIFRKKNQAVTFGCPSSVKTNGETVSIDPQLLFQRLFVTGVQSDDRGKTFKYELCSYSPTLYDGRGIMLVFSKPVLAKAMLKAAPGNGS